MPEENSNMDELLKAYAKKRREEAGAPLEMHPATRQLLQGEVKRVRARPPAESAKSLLLWRIWPRLALGGVMVAALAGMLVWFQPREKGGTQLAQQTSLSGEAQKSALGEAKDLRQQHAEVPATALPEPASAKQPADAGALAKNEVVLAESVERADQPKSLPGSVAESDVAISSSTAAAALPKEQEVAQAGVKQTAATDDFKLELRDENKVAAVPPPAPARVLTPAPAKEESARVAAVQPAAPSAAPASNVALAAAVAETRSRGLEADKADVSKAAGSARGGLYFVQEAEKYRRNLSSPPPPKVLNAFHFNQVGNKIQFFDADGSVYEGEIQLASLGGTELKKRAEAPASTEEAKAKDVGVFADKAQGSYTFQASGTNRLTQQRIVFSGTFSGQAKSGAEKREAQAAPASGNGVIQGKVIVGGTNEFQLRAVQK